MRKVAHTLALAAAVGGLCLTAGPATASPLSTRSSSPSGQRTLTSAQRHALATAAHLQTLRTRHGIITGLARQRGGAPAPDVCVTASGPMGTRKAFTRPDGTFVLAGLARGAYRVEFRGCSPAGRFTGQFYGGATRATAAKVLVTGAVPTRLAPVTLARLGSLLRAPRTAKPGMISAGQRAALAGAEVVTGQLPAKAAAAHAGHVSGRVTTRSGRPLSSVCVLAAVTNGHYFVAEALTSATGRYSLRLNGGRYLIDFLPTCVRHGNYAPQLWKKAGSIGRATVVRVTAGHTVTGIDAALGTGAALAGRVTTRTPSPHPSLGGICVFAVGTGGQHLFQASARTAKDGTFTIGNLATGTYRVSIDPYCSPAPVWLPSSVPPTVTVTNGKITKGTHLLVKLAGAIAGVVKDANGKPLAGICVQALAGNSGALTSTAANGAYRFPGLSAGSYQVSASPGCPNNGPYGSALYPSPVAVRSGATSRANLTLPFDGALTGVVKDALGNPLAGICVQAQGPGFSGGFAITKADGSYTLKKLTPGTNQVEFVPGGVFSSCGNNGNYLPVSLSATITSQATTTLDAILPAGGTISGTVTGQNGQPLSGVCVFSSSQFGGQAVSKADGSFRLRQLFSGSYFVGYEGGCGNQGSVAPQAYQGDPTFFGPASITVTQGSVTAGIDARMKPGATITGRITNRAGHPVGDVCVFLNPVTGAGAGGNFGLGVLDRQGRFSAGNLPPGQYQVIYSGMFNPRRGCARSPYADWQFGGTGVGAAPGLISARGGTVTTGANAILPPAGRISGTVTDTAGRALPNLCVQAIAASGAGTFAGTSRHGTYTLGALPPGRYKVEFTSCSGDFVFFGQTGLNYASQWYKNKLSRASASVVVVRPSVTTTGIDGALARGGSVSGQVTYRPNGRPVSFVCVDALSDRGGVLTDHFALTDRRGHYLVDGLGTDRYELEFQPCSGESALTSAIKGGVAVVAGQLRRGVNSALALGGSVSGTTSALVNGTAQAAPGTCVFAVPARPNSVPVAAFAQQGGAYTATGAAAGQYVLVAGDPFCSVDAPWLTMKVGPNFTVKAGQTTSGVDTSLQVAGAITGAVHGGGNALRGICAEAYPMAGGLGIPVGVTSGAGGQYQITDLQPGQYKIRFAAGCGASGWATRWYKNARTEVGGTVVRVHPAAVTTGIDATLPRG